MEPVHRHDRFDGIGDRVLEELGEAGLAGTRRPDHADDASPPWLVGATDRRHQGRRITDLLLLRIGRLGVHHSRG